MQVWQINLIILWVTQFCSSVGFALSMPFAPYFIQTLGVTDLNAVKLWATLAAAGAPLSMAIMAPIWGLLADRFGRKPMLLRATFGAGIIIGSMAFSPNVLVFVLLRIMQGMFSGVAAAGVTLVACNTPEERQGFALGCLSSSLFSGNMFGLFIGGFLAEMLGYRNTFLLSGTLLMLAGLLVLFGVREKFTRAPQPSSRITWRKKWAALGPGTPLLLLVVWMSVGRRMDGAILPIFIQELHGRLEGAAIWSGLINGAGSVGAVLAGLCGSVVMDRYRPAVLARWIAGGAALGMICTGLAQSLNFLLPLRFAYMLFAAGFDPVLNTWLSKITPSNHKGAIFGLAQMARSCGMTLGPSIGGIIARVITTRAVFWVSATIFLLFIPLMLRCEQVMTTKNRKAQTAE
ncbi:MAG: MFS transporter [Lentisphaeria bacterium]|jgi:DHA1 family multidrug resistance protein-like MFS transporter